MHAYLITMFIVQIIACLGLLGKASMYKINSDWFALVVNIVFLVWTSVLLWS